MIQIPETIATGTSFQLHEDAVTQGFAILAMRDSGKSNLAGVMQEEFARRGDQFIVIDPPAAHIGIRNAMDEKGHPSGPSGIEVLLVGGDKSDCPLPVDRGRELAQVLMETKLSAVINIKTARAKERKDFLTEFGEELYAHNKTPLHLFLEEADELIPQQPDNKEEQAIRHIWRKIVKGGRSSGLGFTIITQRPAMVDKTSLNQIDNLFVMSLMGEGDLTTIRKWLEFHVTDKVQREVIMHAIPKLQRGQCYLLSPRWMQTLSAMTIRRRVTFHAGRTPKRGESAIEPVKYDLGEIAERFKEKLADKEALVMSDQETMIALRHENQVLHQKFDNFNGLLDQKFAEGFCEGQNEGFQEGHMAGQRDVKESMERAYIQGTRDGYQRAHEPVVKFLTELANTQLVPATIIVPADLLAGSSNGKTPDFGSGNPGSSPGPAATITMGGETIPLSEFHPVSDRADYTLKVFKKEPPPTGDGNALSGPQEAILRSLAEWRAIGRTSVPKPMLAAWLGISHSSGSYGNNLGRLRSLGLIDYAPAGVYLTQDGLRRAPKASASVNHGTILRRIEERFSGPQFAIVTVLDRAYPNALTKDRVAQLVGVSSASGSFGNNLGALRTAGIIDYPQPGHARLNDWVYLK